MSGWEPREFTRYEYDDADRVVGSVTEREPEWCRADVEALIAYIEMGRVGPHGQPMSEATDPRGNPSSHDAEWRYVAEPIVDFAQAAIDTASAAYQKQHGDDVPAGLKWGVKKVLRVSPTHPGR